MTIYRTPVYYWYISFISKIFNPILALIIYTVLVSSGSMLFGLWLFLVKNHIPFSLFLSMLTLFTFLHFFFWILLNIPYLHCTWLRPWFICLYLALPLPRFYSSFPFPLPFLYLYLSFTFPLHLLFLYIYLFYSFTLLLPWPVFTLYLCIYNAFTLPLLTVTLDLLCLYLAFTCAFTSTFPLHCLYSFTLLLLYLAFIKAWFL